jgi:hypothetical protein
MYDESVESSVTAHSTPRFEIKPTAGDCCDKLLASNQTQLFFLLHSVV